MNGNGIDTRHEADIVGKELCDMSRDRPERSKCFLVALCFFSDMPHQAVVLVGRDNQALILWANTATTFDSNGRSLFIFLPPPVRCIDTPTKCMVQLRLINNSVLIKSS